ncbi:hypothetical protein Sjap_015559 [Stephania japonica]|uniref:HNH homing endonuclease n=1 Tax=Stephania japonica TaxID=461633 RepID=A0AAP0IL99_9MAGN
MSMSTSPSRSHHLTHNEKDERPRFFDAKGKALCWARAETVPGRHPERWRKDAAGNVVCKRFCNCQGCLCFEYDHIVPFSKGGESVVENCQILQTRVNRFKSDKDSVDKAELRGFSCDVSFTGMNLFWDDIPEVMNYHAGVGFPCTDKELDIIEMAVYGDVIRPGNQCRCRTIAETLGKFKSKSSMPACKLPHDEASS